MSTQLYTNINSISEGVSDLVTTSNCIITHTQKLPYVELEYIQSSGTQYINTGFKPNTNTKINITFMKVGSVVDYERLLGASSSYNNNDLMRNDRDTSFVYRLANGDKTSFNINANTKYTLELANSYAKLNTTTYNFSATSYSAAVNLELLHTWDRYGIFRLYDCKIYNNGTLVRDYIPVKRKSDNMICLYDRVSKTFFTNAGTGVFTAGPEKT